MKFLQHDTGGSLPVIVVQLGDVSEECAELINEICSKRFSVDCKRIQTLNALCEKSGIQNASRLNVRAISFTTIEDAERVARVYARNKLHFFQMAFSTLVFIDFKKIQDLSEKISHFKSLNAYITTQPHFCIYNANESIVNMYSDECSLIFEGATKDAAVRQVCHSLASVAAAAACRMLNIGFKGTPDTQLPYSVRVAKTKADFAVISGNFEEAVEQLNILLVTLEHFNHPEWISGAYILLGMIEQRQHGILESNKIRSNQDTRKPSWWFNAEGQADLECFLMAGGIAESVGNLELSGNAAIYAMLSDFGKVYRNVLHSNVLLNQNSVIDFVTILTRNNRHRVAAYTLYLVGMKGDNSFLIDSINHFKESSARTIEEICFPMIEELAARGCNEPSFVEACAHIMAQVGFHLDVSAQKLMKTIIASNPNSYDSSFGIVFKNIKISPRPIQVSRERIMTRRRSNSTGFFNFIRKQADPIESHYYSIGETICFEVHLTNPYSIEIELKNLRLIPFDSCMDSIVCTPNSTRRVLLRLVATTLGMFTPKTIAYEVFGSNWSSSLQNIVDVHVVEFIPLFSLQSNLLLSRAITLYANELFDFDIIVNNTGSHPITQVSMASTRKTPFNTITGFQLPIQPGTYSKWSGQLMITAGQKGIDATINAFSEGSGYMSSCSINQVLTVIDGIEVERIYFDKRCNSYPEIGIVFEILNKTDQDIDYTSSAQQGKIQSRQMEYINYVFDPKKLLDGSCSVDRMKIVESVRMYEEMEQIHISTQMRQLITKMVVLLDNMLSEINFRWTMSYGHKGILSPNIFAIEKGLLDIIETRKIGFTTQFDKAIVKDTYISMSIRFASEEVVKCKLTIPDDLPIIWEGELVQQPTDGAFTYSLIFGESGEFTIFLKWYTTSNKYAVAPLRIKVS